MKGRKKSRNLDLADVQDDSEQVLVSLVLLFCPDMLDLVERAKREVITERLSAGSSPARRKRKATPFSRMMTLRNAIVRRAFEQLSQVGGTEG